MPHHPGSCGVVEDAFSRLDVAMEDVLFLVLKKRSYGSMYDTLWCSLQFES